MKSVRAEISAKRTLLKVDIQSAPPPFQKSGGGAASQGTTATKSPGLSTAQKMSHEDNNV